MSYCQSGALPTKWVAPYRYQSWFGSSAFPASMSQPLALATTPVNSLYITGSLSIGGGGALNPVLLAPGIPITPSGSGTYRLVITHSGGTLTHAFNVVFQDDEGGPLTTVNFSFTLPDPGSVTKIQLFHGATLLDTLTKSSILPSAAFTYPTGGETFTGTQLVTWNLTPGSTPTAGLRQELEYSVDNGSTWTPVAIDLPGKATSYALDTSLLPKSTKGKLRLWVTDGLNNITVDSAGNFTSPNHPPLANILAPVNGGYVPGGSQTLLQGQATDVDETIALPDNNFLWTMDGTTTLGVGSNLEVVLPNGRHTLTLTVLDRDGATGSTSVTVFVNLLRFYLPQIRR
jgi:hypothetical protein